MECLAKFEPVSKYGKTFYKNLTKGGCQEWILNQQKHPSEVCITINNGESCRLWGNINNTEVLELIQTNKYLYEILHHYPYKVAFDYDLTDINTINDFNETEQLNKVLNIINKYFNNAVIAISGSCCFEKNKFSLHIVLNNYLIKNDLDREKIKVLSTFFKQIDNGFDTSIYSKSRQMKLINQTKPNDKRVQKIILNTDTKCHIITSFFPMETFDIPDFIKLEDQKIKTHFLIEKTKNPFELTSLPDLDIKLPSSLKDMELNELTNEQILTLLPLNKSFTFEYDHLVARYCYNNNISFDTYLSWLKRKHPNLQKTTLGIQMWEDLVKFPKIYLNHILPIIDKYYKELTTDKSMIRFKNAFNIDVVKEKINKIQPIDFTSKDKYLLFNCGMGSGKTTQTINFLKSEQNFLWISPNIALAENTLTRLSSENIECSNYLKFKPKDKNEGILNEQIALMVCLNSLAYIDKANFGVIVIDEIETILEKFYGDDNMMLKCYDIWVNFIRLLRNARKVIILDAFITKTTLDLLNSILSNDETIKLYETPIITNRQVNYISDFRKSIQDIITKLNKGKKLFIYYPLKNDKQTKKYYIPSMKDFYDEVIKETNKEGYMYNADVDDKIKNTIKLCNEEWIQKDFIITNNVITCGVNFDKKHFDEVYLFVANFSLPRQIIQVSYRARILNTEQINIAYLGEMKRQTGFKINENIKCPIYKQLINNVLTERKAPVKQALEFLCKKAGYKQKFIKTETNKELNDFYDKFTECKTKIEYDNIELINEGDLEIYNNLIFDKEATQTIKLQVKKYYYEQLFKNEGEFLNETEKNELRFVKRYIWNKGYFGFIKGIKNLEHNNFIKMIYELNKDDEQFKNGLFPIELNKPKINEAIINEIFEKFKFRLIAKSTKPNKLLLETYNTYFKCEVFTSEYNETTKRTTYKQNFDFLEDLQTFNFNDLKTKLDKFLKPKNNEVLPVIPVIPIIPVIPTPTTTTTLDVWIQQPKLM